MLRPCKVCTHEARDEIDAAIVNNVSYKTLAARFRIPMLAILAHRHHLESIAAAAVPAQPSTLEALLDQMEELHAQCLLLLDSALASGDPLRLSVALGQVRRLLKRLSEMTEQLRKIVRTLRPRSAAFE